LIDFEDEAAEEFVVVVNWKTVLGVVVFFVDEDF
jgi:hypothetical protein